MGPKWNVYVTREIPDAGLKILAQEIGPFDLNPDDRVLAREQLLGMVKGRDGVLPLLTDRIDAEVMDAAGPHCRIFANYAVGFNNIDVEAATERGILITNTPGVLTDTTADHAFALIMSTCRRVVEADKYFRTGVWHGWGPMQFLGMDIWGQTLGIIGCGRIGYEVARRASGFKMKVLYSDLYANEHAEQDFGARKVTLDTLLSEADIISVHVNLTDETRHLLGAQAFEQMKDTAVLVNTSRGPVIDEAALVEALSSGQIWGAGLDVYEDEPRPAPGLTELDNIVCVPHIASATIATRSKMAVLAANNLIAGLKGERPDNLVNEAVWGKHRGAS